MWIKSIVITVSVLILSACGGDDDGGIAPTAETLSGTAAAGAPIVGIVNVKGSAGGDASSQIESDGSYSLDVTDLTAPYMLFAEGIVNGKSIKIYSIALTPGTINITTVTDFIIRNALDVAPEPAYDTFASSTVSEGTLTTAEADVNTMLAPLLTAVGVAPGTDLLTTPFSADHTGIDAALDFIDISYSGSLATVSNSVTGSSFVDDTSTSGVVDGLPASDAIETVAVLSDAAAIEAIFEALTSLYASGLPSSSAITSWFDNVADDYLDGGESKDAMLSDWLLGDGLPVGATLTSTIIEPFDVSGTAYTKGYWIRLFYSDLTESDSFPSAMVFDGSNWLFYGNRAWMETDVDGHAFLSVSDMSTDTFYSGFELALDDAENYAYDQGVRSLVIAGPGLPAEGLVFEHGFPANYFVLYGTTGFLGGSFYSISSTSSLNDSAIEAIPDNAVYTYKLCSNDAATVLADTSNCNSLQEYTAILAKPPLTVSALNESMFASLTSHSTHLITEFNFGGLINIGWSKPEGTISGEVGIAFDSYWVDSEPGPDDTATTVDTTGLPLPTTWASIFIRVEDMWGRDFNMGWGLHY